MPTFTRWAVRCFGCSRNAIETDVLVVIRTNQRAGWGGFDGLPWQFSTYTGAMVIVDQPDVVAALAEPGGYLATRYLDDNFVAALARDVN